MELLRSETDMMIGYHAVPVIVDAYLKGIGNFDAEKALAACVATANLDNYRGIGAIQAIRLYSLQCDRSLQCRKLVTVQNTGICI